MRVLITGGAGFIGSHLAEALLRQGNNVTVLDDLSTGSIVNIQHLKREPGFEYVIDSVMHRAVLAELIERLIGGSDRLVDAIEHAMPTNEAAATRRRRNFDFREHLFDDGAN